MKGFNRRQFLKIGAGVMASFLSPVAATAAFPRNPARRSLSFYHMHTQEKLSICYFERGNYNPAAMKKINHVLRDHYSQKVQPIDPRLIDMLFSINQKLGCTSPFHVISGYRSPDTNARLAKNGNGVAKQSYHMQGKAIDIRLPGCDIRKLWQTCVDLKLGGVGYYPRSDFVHVDTGAFRTWNG
ncbi:DUF882 domain-containing protein [Desulfosarcina sp. OttesenSCG-928-A07]|nr:DUF882 domain-containing protein [Desulfosarcina sp. OttesenSCG-928-G17]MDL2328945.1 DUF882 domain-containing protein [Desulfosarcina sp. OttesenSCG-928-A07]